MNIKEGQFREKAEDRKEEFYENPLVFLLGKQRYPVDIPHIFH